MARYLRVALAQVKVQIKSCLPTDVDGLAEQAGHVWREGKLTPAITVWLFMLQILNGNTAITALRHLGGIAMEASSYCAARKRLPLELFAKLFDAMSQSAGVVVEHSSLALLHGRRVLLGDVTTFTMPDTPALREHFGYPAGQRDGLGFPVGRLIAVIDALSGCVLVAMGCPLFTHGAGDDGALSAAETGRCAGGRSRLLLVRADRASAGTRRGCVDAFASASQDPADA